MGAWRDMFEGLAIESKQDEMIALLDSIDTTMTAGDPATQTTLAAVLTELQQKLEPADLATLSTAAKQDAAKVVLDGILAAIDGLEGNTDEIEAKLDAINAQDFATQTTLAAVLTELGGKLEPSDLSTLATAIKQDTQIAAEQAIQAAVEGTLSTQEQNPIAGYALDATVGNRYSGGKTTVTATVTASGDTTVLSPALGNAIRLYWVSAINDPDEASSPLIIIKIGSTELYRVFAVAHWEVFEGVADEDLVVNLSGTGSVAFTAHYEEFTP